ncbi:MAG: NYN domain-containing protein, partial [Christensenellaceae bacterium]
MENDKRFAVLIDADNVSERYIKFILDEISNDGVTTYKRIYGDWTSPTLTSWKKVLLDYSITPIQQYSYTTGKNSTDSAMIIDAMDILYTDSVEGFCIVSSDSDFTRLASRLREAGKYVVGMGEKKTPSAFIAACNKFKYLEVLAKKIQEDPEQAEQPIVQAETTSLPVVREAVLTIVREISDDDGWAMLGEVGNTLLKRFPDFDVRNYGFSKLTPFVKSLGKFEVNY